MRNEIQQFKKEAEPQVPETYYDQDKGNLRITNAHGEWIPLSESQYTRVLRGCGFSARKNDRGISRIDEIILDLQQRKGVHFCGPIAGYRAGLREIGPYRILVTASPQIIEPHDGDWTVLGEFIRNLLGTDIQLLTFLAWLRTAYISLREGSFLPGQAVVFVGPHDCGKSLLQQIITKILGGRVARPYQAMTDRTSFNADLLRAEHLAIEDEQPSTDYRARRNFGSHIKQITVNEDQRLHAKNCDAITVRPFWRLSVSLNDEPENIMVLPPMDDSIEDKLSIFRVTRTDMPMATDTHELRKAFWTQLESELPCLLHYLMHWEIPVELRSQRFGVKHYHHPEILELLHSMEPEFQLLDCIDAFYFRLPGGGIIQETPRTSITKTAQVIEQDLTATGSPVGNQARKLLSWRRNATGTYLGRLAKTCPERVQNVRKADSRNWRILAPEAAHEVVEVATVEDAEGPTLADLCTTTTQSN